MIRPRGRVAYGGGDSPQRSLERGEAIVLDSDDGDWQGCLLLGQALVCRYQGRETEVSRPPKKFAVPQDAPLVKDRAFDDGTIQGIRKGGTQAWRDADSKPYGWTRAA